MTTTTAAQPLPPLTQIPLPDQPINLREINRGFLVQALDKFGGNQSAAARHLGITRYALRYRMQKHRL